MPRSSTHRAVSLTEVEASRTFRPLRPLRVASERHAHHPLRHGRGTRVPVSTIPHNRTITVETLRRAEHSSLTRRLQ